MGECEEPTRCKDCGGELYEFDDGPDGYDDDVSYISFRCKDCGLKWDGWFMQWEDEIN